MKPNYFLYVRLELCRYIGVEHPKQKAPRLKIVSSGTTLKMDLARFSISLSTAILYSPNYDAKAYYLRVILGQIIKLL